MTGLNREIFVIGSALVLVLSSCQHEPRTIDELVERNTEAMGGRAAIEAIQSIQVDLHITDPGFEVDGVYSAARPGKMRIDVFAEGKHVFTEAFDGKRCWEWDGKESKPASPLARAGLEHGVELPGKLFGLHELRQRGHDVQFGGHEKIDGIDYYVVRLTLRDGYGTTLFIDPNSWLITLRRDFRPLHPDIDPTPTIIEQRSSDFRQVNGVQFAFAGTETDVKTGKVIERTEIKSIKVNPAIEPAFFEDLEKH